MSLVTQIVAKKVQEYFRVGAATVYINESTTNSVDHLHVHIVPRRKGDLEKNDEIYEIIHKYDEV